MIILAIETSCDDTGITIMSVKGTKKSPTFTILANELSSQAKLHSPYGGVYPNLAKREHLKNLPILLARALRKANLGVELPKIDFIAVTIGPGLEPALWTGIVFAKELGEKLNIPIVPVNHMEGHIFSVVKKVGKNLKVETTQFPALSLLISGGHTELVLVKKHLKYEIIGETVDDAAGEAFDKVARILGLPYPGGPEIAKIAKQKRKSPQCPTLRIQKGRTFSRLSFPRPMMHSKNFNFSFSGLKTAVLYFAQKQKRLSDEMKSAIAREFQNSVVDVLVHKTKKAVKKYSVKTLIVAGGVASNKYLRKEIKKEFKNIKTLFPPKSLSTDNSIMIGIAGYFRYTKNKKKIKNSKIKADGGLRL